MCFSNGGQRGFSLVEAIIGLGVMALVISGGLVALGQASLISEKNSKQILADLILRTEVEALRTATWSEISDHHSKISTDGGGNSRDPYAQLISADKQSLLDRGLAAELSSAQLNNSGERGKIAFKVLLRWQDRSGKNHEEARVLVITEGGLSAGT